MDDEVEWITEAESRELDAALARATEGRPPIVPPTQAAAAPVPAVDRVQRAATPPPILLELLERYNPFRGLTWEEDTIAREHSDDEEFNDEYDDPVLRYYKINAIHYEPTRQALLILFQTRVDDPNENPNHGIEAPKLCLARVYARDKFAVLNGNFVEMYIDDYRKSEFMEEGEWDAEDADENGVSSPELENPPEVTEHMLHTTGFIVPLSGGDYLIGAEVPARGTRVSVHSADTLTPLRDSEKQYSDVMNAVVLDHNEALLYSVSRPNYAQKCEVFKHPNKYRPSKCFHSVDPRTHTVRAVLYEEGLLKMLAQPGPPHQEPLNHFYALTATSAPLASGGLRAPCTPLDRPDPEAKFPASLVTHLNNPVHLLERAFPNARGHVLVSGAEKGVIVLDLEEHTCLAKWDRVKESARDGFDVDGATWLDPYSLLVAYHVSTHQPHIRIGILPVYTSPWTPRTRTAYDFRANARALMGLYAGAKGDKPRPRYRYCVSTLGTLPLELMEYLIALMWAQFQVGGTISL